MDSKLLVLFTSADDMACEAAAVDLGRQGSAGLMTLSRLLTASAVEVRFWAVRGLWANGSPEAITMLIRALLDESDMVRSGAALALGELRAEVAINPLIRLIINDASDSGNLAAVALAKIGPLAAPLLGETMQSPEAWVRLRAIRALIAIQTDEAITAIFAALQDESYAVRYYAEDALAQMAAGQMVYLGRLN